MTITPVPETLTNAELLEAAHDLLTDLLDHSVELEDFCPLCADSARTLYEQIETRLDEINEPDNPHNKTS